MKAKIHPKYEECKVSCSCGNTFTTRSVVSEISTSICSQCHPFFTGRAGRFVDTAGRIEKFQKRYQIGDGQETKAAIKKRAAQKAATPGPAKPEKKAEAKKSGAKAAKSEKTAAAADSAAAAESSEAKA